MTKSERFVENIYEKKGYVVIKTNPYNGARGLPDFLCINFKSLRLFFIEVKLPDTTFDNAQKKKIKEIIKKGFEVRLAKVYPTQIIVYELSSTMEMNVIENIPIIGQKRMTIKKCQKCGYEWEARINNPKTCPECKTRKWRVK